MSNRPTTSIYLLSGELAAHGFEDEARALLMGTLTVPRASELSLQCCKAGRGKLATLLSGFADDARNLRYPPRSLAALLA